MGKEINNEKCPEKQCPDEIKKLGWGVRHSQVACMCVCVTALLMVRSSMGVAILAMTDRTRKNESITVYDWDKETQGLILSSFFWGYVTMQIPAGLLAKRFGGKPVLMFALLTNAVLCLLVPMLADVGGWQLVCASRVAVGLTQACTFPASHTLLGRWLPDKERVMLSGIVYGGTQLGTILGMPVSGLLASTSLGWPLVFYAMAGLMACTAVMWQFLTASSPAQHRLITSEELEYIESSFSEKPSLSRNRVRTPWRHILTSRAVWALICAHIGAAYGFVMLFVDMPTYLEKGLKISLKNSASLSALPYIGMWLGSVLSTAICEKVYNRGLLSAVACRKIFNSIGAFGLTIGLIGLAFVENTVMAIIWLIVGLTLSGFYIAGFLMNHLDLSPNLGGLLLSLTNFIANIGSVFTPIVTSLLLQNDPTDLSRWRYVFLVAAGLSVATNAVYVLFGSSDLQPWDHSNFLQKENAISDEIKPVMNEEKEKEDPVK